MSAYKFTPGASCSDMSAYCPAPIIDLLPFRVSKPATSAMSEEGESSVDLPGVHGVLMIIAWLILAELAQTIAWWTSCQVGGGV